MAGIITDPIDAVSEIAVPDIPEKTIDAPILASDSPPLICPTILLQNLMILSVIPQLFIRFPGEDKSGYAQKDKNINARIHFKGNDHQGVAGQQDIGQGGQSQGEGYREAQEKQQEEKQKQKPDHN
jgi:hypothetical protein